MSQTNNSRAPVLVACALAFLTLLFFWPVTTFEFVNYDDPDYVTENPQVQKGLSFEGVASAFARGHAGNWHPVTWLSHMLDVQIFGMNPGFHHLTSLLLHTASVVLLFLFLRKVTGSTWRSSVAAALFAWHPLHVESVAWVSERKDVLSGFFAMLTLLAYTRFVETKSQSLTGQARWYAATLVCFALGLMSKPMLVTLPFVLLLLDWWPFQRSSNFKFRIQNEESGVAASGCANPTITFSWKDLRALAVEKIPFFILVAISCGITLWAQAQKQAVVSMEVLTFGDRLGNAMVSLVRYLGKTIWPVNLAVYYPHPGEWPLWMVIAAAFILAGLTVLVLILARRVPALPVGWFWFVGMLVPVVGLVQVGGQAMADRYTYLPLIGIFIAIAWSPRPGAFRPMMARFLTAGAILALVIFAALTMRQVAHWRDSVTLFEHALRVTSNNPVAHNNLGNAFLDAGELDRAKEQFVAALAIEPGNFHARASLGNVALLGGNLEEAAKHFEAALALRPDEPDAHVSLGVVLMRQGRVDAAIERFQKTLELNPQLFQAHLNLAHTLSAAGRNAEAIDRYQVAAKLQPDSFPARFNLGFLLAREGRFAEALPHAFEAVRLNPDSVMAHYSLAVILAETGDIREAIRQNWKALRLDPYFPEALNNLAWILATHPDETIRNGKEAVRLAERACEKTERKIPLMLGTLAAAYAEAGRFDDATSTAKEAEKLAIELSQAGLAAKNRELAAKFSRGIPYRDTK